MGGALDLISAKQAIWKIAAVARGVEGGKREDGKRYCGKRRLSLNGSGKSARQR